MNIHLHLPENVTPDSLRELLETVKEVFPSPSMPVSLPGGRNLTGRSRKPDTSRMGPLELELYEKHGQVMALPAGTSPVEREGAAQVRLMMAGGKKERKESEIDTDAPSESETFQTDGADLGDADFDFE